jgi:hypothetical protein
MSPAAERFQSSIRHHSVWASFQRLGPFAGVPREPAPETHAQPSDEEDL